MNPIRKTDPADYRKTLLEHPTSHDAVDAVAADYHRMILAVLDELLNRYEQRENYPFLDTKLSVLHGRDHDPKDPIRGLDRIYGWIQGRGLESLAGHITWLKRCPHIAPELAESLADRTTRVLTEVMDNLEALRAANGGRLFFCMNQKGTPLRMDLDHGVYVPFALGPDDPPNMSEMFYCKGLAAAGHVLGNDEKLAEACRWYERIHEAILQNTFASDQQPLDPKNRAVTASKEGRFKHGSRMIGLGAVTRLLRCTGEAKYAEYGRGYLDYILDRHINEGPDRDICRQWDMWEFTNAAGEPFLEADGVLLNDPGHATECVGLALEFLRCCEETGQISQIPTASLDRYHRSFPEVLVRNFQNGISDQGFGIVKGVDLVSRKKIISDIPWWPLPETIRAVLEVCRMIPKDQRPQFAGIGAACSNAFVQYFVRPEVHLMAYQTIDETGKAVDVIPASPDADPGYHTNLSIIDALEIWETLR